VGPGRQVADTGASQAHHRPRLHHGDFEDLADTITCSLYGSAHNDPAVHAKIRMVVESQEAFGG
jgi:hypothetical protein